MRLLVFSLLIVLLTGTAVAQTPAGAIESVLELNASALASQKRIDGIYEQRQQLLSDISTIEQEGTTFALRNRELEQTLAQVQQNLAEIDTDLRAVTETQTGIISLLDTMITALERFIELDLPFQLEQRRAVINRLRADLGRADIGVTEKYQSVVSAYLNEVRFGHNNAVSQERIETPLGNRMAEVLRLGRAGLWYVTADGTQAGRWDPVRRQWTDSDTDAHTVMTGIRIVRETASPAILNLPIQLDLS